MKVALSALVVSQKPWSVYLCLSATVATTATIAATIATTTTSQYNERQQLSER